MSFYDRIGFEPRPLQTQIRDSQMRFNVVICHRRFGKTLFCCADALEKLAAEELPNPRAAYFCPTKVQAKRVSWDYFKQLAEPLTGKSNEIELKIDFPDGGRINLGTAERPDYNRGVYLDHVVIDEPAMMPTRLWSEILRPALADRKGTATFIGTPAGRHGLLYTLWKMAEEEDDWSRFMYKASETHIVDQGELTAAAKVMTRDEYAQEWECSFSAAIKGAYLGRTLNTIEDKGRLCRLDPYQELPIHIGLDCGERQENNCWWFQVLDNGDIHVLDHETYRLSSISDMVIDWKSKPYAHIGKVLVHRQKQGREYMSVRAQTLQGLGFDVIEWCPEWDITSLAENARNKIGRMWFEKDQCFHGLEALRQFRAPWDDKKECFKNLPEIDWSYECGMSFLSICDILGKMRLGTAQEPDYSVLDAARAWG